MQRFLRAAGVCACLTGSVSGQTAVPPSFEVAAVKANRSGARRSGVNSDPERLTARNATVKQLIHYAYSLPGYRISGQDWIETERWDVAAKAEAPAPDGQMRLMLQTLLADRFQLRFHRETKQMAVYWLVAGKNGFKPPGAKESDMLLKDGPPALQPGRAGVRFLMQRSDLPGLAEGLSRVLDRPVLDKTGIADRFVFYLEWAPDTGAPGSGNPADGAHPPPEPGPSIYAALQQKFGLRLEPARAPVEILVVDHAERPSEN